MNEAYLNNYLTLFFARKKITYYNYFLFRVTQELNEEEGEAVVMAVLVGDTLEEDMDKDVCQGLPKQRLCGAHTVSLMGTTDVNKVVFLH